MKRTRIFAKIFITLFLFFFICQFSYGEGNIKVDNNVYIIVVNKLTLLDIEKMSNLNNLIDEGNFGLMNVRGISGYRGGESFATINASAKAYANNESSQFHNLNDGYKEIYENRVTVLDKEYAIGNIQMGRLYNQNESNNYSPYLGALGDSLHSRGLKTAAFGNSDTDEEIIRTSALIAMDSKGLIDYGNLDNIIIEDLDYPYGFKTDYNKILDNISDIKLKASLILIDTGDLSRLNSYSNFLSLDMFNYKRELILDGIDEFIGNLVDTIEKEKSLVMVISPNSGEERIDGNKLSPVILWGNSVKKGIAISSTTNRAGIVSNLDIAPTIANFLNLSLENMAGNIIKSVEKDNSLNYLRSINGRINIMSKVRSKTLLTYGIISIILMLIIISLFFANIKLDNRIGEWFKTLLLLLYGLPIIFVLSSIFAIDNLFKFSISLMILTGVFVFIARKYNSSISIYVITFSYFIMIVLDIVLNGAITKFSILSHDPIIGARYFGIGNEMVGIFLAVTTLSAGLLYKKSNNKIIPILALLLSVALVGHPKLGANVGGTISLLSASLYFILETIDKQLNLRNIIIIIIVISIVIITLGYIDTRLNPNPTHLGKTLISINDKGISIVKNIINRKLLMNIRLVGISIWTKVLFVNILVQVIVSYLYGEKVRKLMKDGLGKGFVSCIVGSLIGFLVNDSGLVLSAISINLITILLLFVIVNDEEIYTK